MTSTRALLLAGVLVAGGPAGAAPLYVDDGCDPPGTGSAGDPFCTIQEAIDAANPNDTIVVHPGTYAECVINQGIPLTIEAADLAVPNRPANSTIIDGTTACGPELPQDQWNSTVVLAQGSTLRGFTIRGAGRSGVTGFGSVQITRNVIEANAADFGGGIYVYAATADYGDAVIDIIENVVQDNVATIDGGGVYVYAPADPLSSADVEIRDNVVRRNDSASAGGGLGVLTDSSGPGAFSTAVITQNVIEGNAVTVSEGYPTGYGGGVWAATFGYGTETLRITENQVRTNTAETDGGGISAWLQASLTADHTVEVASNTVDSNEAQGNGGGMDLYAQADTPGGEAFTGELVYSARDNVVTNNVAGGAGGGILATMLSFGTANPDMTFELVGNEVRGNVAGTGGGGIALNVGATGEPSPSVFSPAAAAIELRNNLIVQNEATSQSNSAVGGGIAIVMESIGEAVAEVEIDRATIADNLTDDGGGGVHLSALTELDSAGTEGAAQVLVTSSIVSENAGYGIGGDVPGGTGNIEVIVRHTTLFGNAAGTIEPTLLPNVTQIAVGTADPLLDPSWVPGLCSPTIDAGDPAIPVGAEPGFNGGRVNQGHLGGTAEAVPGIPDLNGDGAVDGVDVLRIALAFASITTDPHYSATADVDDDGDVDGDDLAAIVVRFGASCP